jgi:hypothetical protein
LHELIYQGGLGETDPMVQDWKFKAKLINKGKKTKPISKSIYAKSPAQDQ